MISIGSTVNLRVITPDTFLKNGIVTGINKSKKTASVNWPNHGIMPALLAELSEGVLKYWYLKIQDGDNFFPELDARYEAATQADAIAMAKDHYSDELHTTEDNITIVSIKDTPPDDFPKELLPVT